MGRLFLDLDGTLARFYEHTDYLEKMRTCDYFRSLRPYENMLVALKKFISNYGNKNIFILSACIQTPWCQDEKIEWLKEHLPEVSSANYILIPCGESKPSHVPDISSNDILIDDYRVSLEDWLSAGGTAIKAINEINNTTKSWNGDILNVDSDSAEEIYQNLVNLMAA